MTPPTSRDQILARIAANLRRARGGVLRDGHAHRTPPRATVEAPSAMSLVERFTTEVEALGGHVHAAASAAEATEAIAGICQAQRAPCVLAWYEDQIGVPGLRAALFERRIGYDTGWLPAEPSARADRLASLERIAVGVTGAAAGIADSGTIALLSGPGRPRLASLLPPVHVAVLRADRLCPALPDLLASHPRFHEEGSNLVLITGPSRTADIEMTLTRGVHGPADLHIVLLG